MDGRRMRLVTPAGVWVCLAAPEAHAYLDPGTGSMLLQIVLGGLAGLGVLGKLYWHRIRAFFGARDGGGGEEEEEGTENENERRGEELKPRQE